MSSLGSWCESVTEMTRRWVFRLLRLTGLPWLLRELIHRRRVTILLFHDPRPDAVRRILDYVCRHYHVISLAHYLDCRRAGDVVALPPKALILTFDDGHRRNADLLPFLRERGVPVSIFLCASIVGTDRGFWFLHPAIGSTVHQLKRLGNDGRLARLAAAGFEQEGTVHPREALSAEEVAMMRPWVQFESHTCFHPVLPMCSDEVARAEIAGSKQILEQQFGLTIRALAFPNGDYSERDVVFAREAGYECALTVDPGVNSWATDLFHLRRLGVSDDPSGSELVVKASGLWAALKHVAGSGRVAWPARRGSKPE